MIIPYIEQNGAWTISDSTMFYIWEQMVKEGNHKIVFISGGVKSGREFIKWFKNPLNHCQVHFDDDNDPVFMSWINNVSHGSAYWHFCGFGKDIKNIAKHGKESLEKWWSFEDDGKPLFHVFMGVTPASNKLAVNFLKKLGGKSIGEIPNIVWDSYNKKRVGGVFSYIRRDHG